MGFLNTNSMPRLVEKLADGDNIKITGNSKGSRVGTVIKKIVEKADDVTKAIEQEVVNDGYSFKVGTGNVDVSTDVQDGFGEVGVKGVTYQNLWNINKVNGATIEGNTVKVLASANNYKFCGIYLKDSCLKPNTTYTLITNVFENTLDGRFNPCIGHSASVFKTNAKEFQAKTTGVSMSVLTTTSTFTTEDIGIRTIVLNDCTEGFIKYNMLILEGDYSNASNLPSYFEGIVGVGDKSKNLFNSLDKTYDKQWFESNGKLILSDAVGRTAFNHFIPCKPNTNYYFSSDTRIGLKGIFEVSDLEGNNCKILKNTDATKESFTTTSSAKFIVIKANTIVSDNITIQLEEGSTATAYEPYYDGHKIEILSQGKNLFDETLLTKNSTDSIDIFEKDGYIHYKSKKNGVRFEQGRDFELKPNTKYIVSGIAEKLSGATNSTAKIRVAYWNESTKTYITYVSAMFGNPTVFTTTDKTIVSIGLYSSDSLDSDIGAECRYKDIQIEEVVGNNTQKTPYTPYVSDKTQILLDEPLMKLPNGVCDEITRDGKLIRRVGKVVFDGTENWSATGYGGHPTRNTFETGIDIEPIGVAARAVNSFCDRFIYDAIIQLPNEDNHYRIAHTENDNGNNYYFLFCPDVNTIPFRDVTAWKQWLSENPTTVYYELTEPIVTELPTPCLRIFKDGHITFNTLVAPESTHVVQLNKSAQIERSIREVQGLDSRVGQLESFYDDMILETSHKLNLLTYDFEYTKESEDI